MTYEVEFKEEAVVERIILCTVEADNPDEIEEKIKRGDYEFDDCWEDNDLGSEFVGIVSVLGCEDE